MGSGNVRWSRGLIAVCWSCVGIWPRGLMYYVRIVLPRDMAAWQMEVNTCNLCDAMRCDGADRQTEMCRAIATGPLTSARRD